jgi:uncharacterized repeat protein (TIGR01451 family)
LPPAFCFALSDNDVQHRPHIFLEKSAMNLRLRYYLVFALLMALVLTTALLASHSSRAASPWYVAPSGSDSNDCQGSATPCATIAGVLNQGGFVAGDTILVATGTYTGTESQVVLLNKDAVVLGGWDPDFAVQGSRSTIDGGGSRRGVEVVEHVVSLDRFVIQNGFHVNQGGGIRNSSGVLTLTNSIVKNNVSKERGGGIINFGTLTISNTTISANSAGDACCTGGGGGGGIEHFGGVVRLINSTVSDNTIVGGFSGSGIDAFGMLFVENSTITGNHGGSGEGISSLGGTIHINNSTIVDNGNYGLYSIQATIDLRNTILAHNGYADCFNNLSYGGTITSLGYNLIGTNSGCTISSTDLIGVDPLLDTLRDNGGLAPTRALVPESPAVNAGNPAGCTDYAGGSLIADQRGLSRFGRCDIGAYELQPLGFSKKMSNLNKAQPGVVLTYTIVLTNGGQVSSPSVVATDTLPASLSYIDTSLVATNGSYGYANGVITWTGSVEASAGVSITYQALISPAISLGTSIVNSVVISGGEVMTRAAVVDLPLAKVFLPVTMKPKPGIYGYVTLNGAAAAGVPLELRFFSGSYWSTAMSIVTDSAGRYMFTDVPALGAGQKYHVRFLNPSSTADGRLALWYTRELTAYAVDNLVAIGNFDLADIVLQSPAPGVTVALPQTFRWARRSATPSDQYEFNLFDPVGTAFFYTIPPLGYVDNYRLNVLPSGFVVKKMYGWFIAAYSPDGGYGESFYYNPVKF